MNLKTISNAPVGTTKVIKRVLLLWLACCLLIFIASCSQADEGTPADTTAASTTDVAGETDENAPDATDESAESVDPSDTTGNPDSNSDASFSSDDLEVVIDGTSYKLSYILAVDTSWQPALSDLILSRTIHSVDTSKSILAICY